MTGNFLDNDIEYWRISESIRNIYTSNGSMSMLLDFERVLDEVNIYAFENWMYGELVHGPEINRYSVSCTFMWPKKLAPDINAVKRLIPFNCTARLRKTTLKIPIKVESYDDFIPGTKKPKIIKQKVQLIEITIPKNLMSDIKSASLYTDLYNIDDINKAYEDDLDNEENRQEDGEADVQPEQF
jgi:hypothetical protein